MSEYFTYLIIINFIHKITGFEPQFVLWIIYQLQGIHGHDCDYFTTRRGRSRHETRKRTQGHRECSEFNEDLKDNNKNKRIRIYNFYIGENHKKRHTPFEVGVKDSFVTTVFTFIYLVLNYGHLVNS